MDRDEKPLQDAAREDCRLVPGTKFLRRHADCASWQLEHLGQRVRQRLFNGARSILIAIKIDLVAATESVASGCCADFAVNPRTESQYQWSSLEPLVFVDEAPSGLIMFLGYRL